MTPLNTFYNSQKEPLNGCLMALRYLILAYNPNVSEKWYYRLPCFFYNNRIFCYVWIEKKTNLPYIAFYPGTHLTHPSLQQANRTRSKMLHIQPEKDLPIDLIYEIINESLQNGH